MAGCSRATAYAPASVGNVAVGFDILGHAIDAVGDRVVATRSSQAGVRVVGISGNVPDLPRKAADNTAGAAVLALLGHCRPGWGVELAVEKGIPLGSGMGGSAASAVAAVVAANALLDEPLPQPELLRFALAGEAVASGSAHSDNVAASLLGGLVFAYADGPLRLARIPVPDTVRCVLVHPDCEVRTRDAREALAAQVPLATVVAQTANLAGLMAGCFAGDANLIARSLRDVMIEPQRAHLVPGFDAVAEAARGAGAFGCSLSGSGPSMFAWCMREDAAGVAKAMGAAFAALQVTSQHWISAIDAPGARLEESVPCAS